MNDPNGSMENFNRDPEVILISENAFVDTRTNSQFSQNKPKTNISLIVILLILLAGVALTAFFGDSILSALGIGSKSCEYQGQTYKPGESVPSIDNCNLCACDASGQVACTGMACLNGDESEKLNTDENNNDWSSFSHQTGFSISYPKQLSIKAIDMTADYMPAPETADHIYIYDPSTSEGFEQRYVSIIDRIREIDNESQRNPVVKGETEMFYLGTEESGKFDSYLVTIPIVEESIKILVSNDPQKKETANKILETFKFNSPVANPKVSLRGKLQRIQRPSPEINYDYQLILIEPYFYELNAMGPRDIENIVVVPENEIVKEDLEKYILSAVKIEGNIEWGLAETRHLLAKKVTPLD